MSTYAKFSREFKWFLRPGSDAVLHMSQIEFEFRSTQINLDRLTDLIQTPILIPGELNSIGDKIDQVGKKGQNEANCTNLFTSNCKITTDKLFQMPYFT